MSQPLVEPIIAASNSFKILYFVELLSKYDLSRNFDRELKKKSNRVEDSSHHEEELQAILNKAHDLGFSGNLMALFLNVYIIILIDYHSCLNCCYWCR